VCRYAGVLYYVSFAVLMLLMLLNFLIAIISEAYIETQEDGNETASFFTEVGLYKLNQFYP
jgi:hypothetical protein